MPKTTLYAINGSGGAFTNIPATIPAHVVEIVEDGSVTAQGLQVQFAGDDNFATTDTYTPGQPIEIVGNGTMGVLGYPAQGTVGAFNHRPADLYCKVKSATATATTVRVTELETGS